MIEDLIPEWRENAERFYEAKKNGIALAAR